MVSLSRILVLLLCIRVTVGLYPVLLIPGDLSSKLMVKYINVPPHQICGVQNEWFTLWINLKYALPLEDIQDCMVQTMQLRYDPKTRCTSSPDFCEVKVPGFGTVDTVTHLLKYRFLKVAYYENIIRELEETFGYKRNQNIRGAPFDFRKGPNEIGPYLESVKTLIETMSADAGEKPVIIIGHSMGNLHILHLLRTLDQGWKDRYIKTFISISAPYSGSVKAVQSVLSGYLLPVPWFRPETLKPLLTSWPSTFYLFPSSKRWTKQVMVTTKIGNFTAETLSTLLRLSLTKYGVEHYEDTSKTMEEVRAPNVSMFCIYSNGIPSVNLLDYRSVNFLTDQPKIGYGDGDGTVNLESLKLCGSWKVRQSHPISEYMISEATHYSIMTDTRNVAIIRNIFNKILNDFEP